MSKRAAVPGTILKLSYPEDLQALANLGAPTNERLSENDLKKVLRVAQASYDLWVAILENPRGTVGKKAKVLSPITGKKIISRGKDLRDLITLKVGAYYGYAMRILLGAPNPPRRTELPPGFDWKIVNRVFDRLKDLERGVKATDERAASAESIAIAYLLGLSNIYHAGTRTSVPWSTRTLEVGAQKSLSILLAIRHTTMYWYQKVLTDVLIKSLLDYQIQYLMTTVESLDKQHHSGVFSAIRLPELSLLARRSESVIKKHGLKHVEKVFERQLALIFQSFGLYVVPTQTGKSTPDLICFSPDARASFSFIVEAKTGKRPYALPVKDARALKDYARDVSAALKTLPPLKFVLIVANTPAKTMDAKITALQSSMGVPVRFCTARQIAELRETVPGPLPMETFLGEVLKSDPLLAEDFAARVAQGYEAVQGAHVKFAEQLLSVQQGRLSTEQAPTQWVG